MASKNAKIIIAVAAVAAAGVGGYLVMKPSAETAPKVAATAPAATKTATQAATPAKPEPLKIAFSYIGPIGDGGWSFAHDSARRAVAREFGDKVQATFIESVSEADAEKQMKDLIAKGNKVSFGTTFGYMDTMLKVANANKGVKFEHATGYKTSENMRTYDARTYEGAYMAGIIAGSMTKSNTLGVVGSVPIPEVIRNINSFTMGAQSVNPNVKTKVFWINSWFDPAKELEGATGLINAGADILMQNVDSPTVLKTAEERGVRAFGWNSDMYNYGPKAILASSVINWQPYYAKTVQQVMDNKWVTGSSWLGVKDGAIDLVGYADDIPTPIREKVDEVRNGLKNGTFTIWKGPIVTNDGEQKLANGEVASDSFLSGLNFYVKGVEGKIPSK